MIRTIITTILAAAFSTIAFGTMAYAETGCRAPLAPVIPNGETASRDEIITALNSIKKDFQPAIKNFQNCISTEKTAIGDIATANQIQEWDILFDAAYALESQVAEQMNVAIRAFKARAANKAE